MQLTAYKVFILTDFLYLCDAFAINAFANIHKASSTLCSLIILNVGNSKWLSMTLQRRCHG